LPLKAQEPDLDSLLKRKAKEVPALNEKVSISVSNTSIQEFMRGVANSSGLNIDVDPKMDLKVINNFNNVRVLDMLVFLSKEYDLQVDVIGNIITVAQKEIKRNPHIFITYNQNSKRISLDISDEELFAVSKAITQETGMNVMANLPVRNQKISCFIKEMPFEDAIGKLAASNGLLMDKSDDGFYMIDEGEKKESTNQIAANANAGRTTARNRTSRSQNTSSGKSSGEYYLDISLIRPDSLIVEAENAPVDQVLKEMVGKKNFNYFISPEIEETVSGRFSSRNVNEILTFLLSGTEVTHKMIDGVYIIGPKKTMDYNAHEVILLENRSVDKITEFIPADLKESLEVIEFTELNSLFVSGPEYQVREFRAFTRSIDKVVPVILIEVVLIYVNKTYTVSTGIQAGLGDGPVSTGGTLFPEINMDIGADQINKVLNGLGWVNLGNVKPNFYLSLQAMETQGLLEIESTPKLSTLNGHEATMAIGNTEYYLEERTDIIGTQNPTQTTSQQYKSVNAELSIKIRPIMSGDEQITLEIEVSQSDFTERIAKTAPPGTVNRDFNSLIRVKNQEMILLGGLMEKRDSDSGSGVPILSRLPLIKWLFSSRTNEDSDSKLSVLIRPTIIN
jgi:type IV pilus assembly protein PilQ